MQKQVSKQSLAIIALSILLAISMALTATFAAFATNAKVTGSITFTRGIILQYTDNGTPANGDDPEAPGYEAAVDPATVTVLTDANMNVGLQFNTSLAFHATPDDNSTNIVFVKDDGQTSPIISLAKGSDNANLSIVVLIKGLGAIEDVTIATGSDTGIAAQNSATAFAYDDDNSGANAGWKATFVTSTAQSQGYAVDLFDLIGTITIEESTTGFTTSAVTVEFTITATAPVAP